MTPPGRTVFLRIVVLCLVIRVVLQILGMASVAAHDQPVSDRAISMWSSWDAPHYLRIAEVGYQPEHPRPPECSQPNPPVHPCDDHLFIVFFPLFPAVVAAVAFVARNLIVSGLIVSLAATIGACWFLYRLVERDEGHDQGWRCVLLLLSFPTAYYLSAPYSEALFLFAVVAAIYAARIGAWERSAIAGALATGTRVTGIALFPALLVEAFRGSAPAKQRGRRLGAIAIAGAGIAVYLAINQIVHGDPFRFLEVQRTHWFQRVIPPWQSLIDAVHALRSGPLGSTEQFIYWGRIAGFAFAFPVLLAGIRRLDRVETTYAWSGFVLIMSAAWLISLPRYLLVLYPIFMVGADVIRSRRAMAAAVVVGSVIQAGLFWRYAVGAWTF